MLKLDQVYWTLEDELLRNGVIAAIKLARKLTGCGLVEAKTFIDTIAAARDAKETPMPETKIGRQLEPIRQYGTNQKMIARFAGTCFLCAMPIREGTDTIMPMLSEKTVKGRHPWVHEACAEKDLLHPVAIFLDEASDLDLDAAPKSKWLIDPPRISQRQVSVVGKNLEAVMKALAANPGQSFDLVPVGETTPVLTTEAIQPKPKEEVTA
jgi:hypothetical protein